MDGDNVAEFPTNAVGERSIRDRIANSEDIGKELVTIPEWDGVTIEVRSITLAQRNEINDQSRDRKSGVTDTAKYYPRLIVASCFDPATGERVFSMRDIPMLENRNVGAIDRLAKAAGKLSGVLIEEPDDDEDLDDDEKLARAEARGEAAIAHAGKDFSSNPDSGTYSQ